MGTIEEDLGLSKSGESNTFQLKRNYNFDIWKNPETQP
jgi:hypothetical protein